MRKTKVNAEFMIISGKKSKPMDLLAGNTIGNFQYAPAVRGIEDMNYFKAVLVHLAKEAQNRSYTLAKGLIDYEHYNSVHPFVMPKIIMVFDHTEEMFAKLPDEYRTLFLYINRYIATTGMKLLIGEPQIEQQLVKSIKEVCEVSELSYGDAVLYGACVHDELNMFNNDAKEAFKRELKTRQDAPHYHVSREKIMAEHKEFQLRSAMQNIDNNDEQEGEYDENN